MSGETKCGNIDDSMLPSCQKTIDVKEIQMISFKSMKWFLIIQKFRLDTKFPQDNVSHRQHLTQTGLVTINIGFCHLENCFCCRKYLESKHKTKVNDHTAVHWRVGCDVCYVFNSVNSLICLTVIVL